LSLGISETGPIVTAVNRQVNPEKSSSKWLHLPDATNHIAEILVKVLRTASVATWLLMKIRFINRLAKPWSRC